jgi:hypothetical protein
MNFAGGLILLAVAVGMILIAWPRGGEVVPFLRE